MDLDLDERVAVVTGGASGIGRAIAELFAQEGAHVALWDLSPGVTTIAEQIRESLPSPPGRATPRVIGLTVDVVDEQSLAAAVDETGRLLGPIDHVVHAAAIGSGKFGFPFLNLQPSDWRRTLDVNIMGLVHVAHAVTPQMISRKSGTIVSIASVAGQIGSQTDPPYSASKAANINFVQCLARDLAPYSIRANTVCPGMVQTPLNRSVWQAWNDQQPPELQQSYDNWAAEKIRKVVPLGRWQQPADVANMVVFLSSSRAAQITGQTINVDGGFVMHW